MKVQPGNRQALVAQRIEHLTTDQKVGGSSPSKRTFKNRPVKGLFFMRLIGTPRPADSLAREPAMAAPIQAHKI
jgi:hypothetical protein